MTTFEDNPPVLQLLPTGENGKYVMIIRTGDKYLKVNRDGTIENDHDVDLDEAARTFWRALATVYGVKVEEHNG